MMSNEQLADRLEATFVAVADATRLQDRSRSVAAVPTLVTPTLVEPSRRGWRLGIAALAVAVALAGVVAITRRSDGTSHVRAGDPGQSSPSLSFDRGSTPPTLTLPGWSLTSSQIDTMTVQDPTANRLFLIVDDPKLGFAGPRIKVGVATSQNQLGPPSTRTTFGVGPNAQPVDINGTTGYLGRGNDKIYLAWSPVSAAQDVYVTATGASTDQVLTLARGLHVAADLQAVTATAVPEGLRVTPIPPLTDQPAPTAEYKFQRGDTLLQINLYPGGRTAFEGRVDDPAHDVPIRGTVAAMNNDTSYGPPGSNPQLHSYRVDLLDGRWAVEIAGGPFADQASFLAAVNAIETSS